MIPVENSANWLDSQAGKSFGEVDVEAEVVVAGWKGESVLFWFGERGALGLVRGLSVGKDGLDSCVERDQEMWSKRELSLDGCLYWRLASCRTSLAIATICAAHSKDSTTTNSVEHMEIVDIGESTERKVA